MRRLCVYCGSNSGNSSSYATAAEALGAVLVSRDIELVYGGASKGLMGVLAATVMRLGGRVHGVIPKLLVNAEVASADISELHVVDTMHARKAHMAELADAFIAMPGGFGTLDELFEIATWGQLKLHTHPFGLLNVSGYFDDLLRYLDRAVDDGFLRTENRAMLQVSESPDGLLDLLAAYEPPDVGKWL